MLNDHLSDRSNLGAQFFQLGLQSDLSLFEIFFWLIRYSIV
jgi:hypothetical protein